MFSPVYSFVTVEVKLNFEFDFKFILFSIGTAS